LCYASLSQLTGPFRERNESEESEVQKLRAVVGCRQGREHEQEEGAAEAVYQDGGQRGERRERCAGAGGVDENTRKDEGCYSDDDERRREEGKEAGVTSASARVGSGIGSGEQY